MKWLFSRSVINDKPPIQPPIQPPKFEIGQIVYTVLEGERCLIVGKEYYSMWLYKVKFNSWNNHFGLFEFEISKDKE